MARRRTHHSDDETRDSGNGPQVRQEEPPNGASGRAAAQHPDGRENAPAPPARERAEEMVDQLAERLGHYTGVIGHKILWLAARAREEAEDIWAEAQALRQQNRQRRQENRQDPT